MPADLVEVRDVVMVRAVTSDEDGSFVRWSLRQVPEVQGGFMAMDVITGRVMAIQGGFSYQASVFNRATQATRQPGSSFKPFVYAAALDLGWSPMDFVEDTPLTITTPGSGPWTPKNYDGEFKGMITLAQALAESRNIPAVRVSEAVGREVVRKVAADFGLDSDLAAGPALALGASESTLITMTGAYAGILNGGSSVTPYGMRTRADSEPSRWRSAGFDGVGWVEP